jgi:hypothetical protein
MKIQTNINITKEVLEEALRNLVDTDFSIQKPLNEIQETMDYSEYEYNIEVREDGVYFPTEYKISYKGTNNTDNQSEISPVDFRKIFELSELLDEANALIEEDRILDERISKIDFLIKNTDMVKSDFVLMSSKGLDVFYNLANK